MADGRPGLLCRPSDRGSSEKAGRWALAEREESEGGWGSGGIIPRKFLKIQVQICAIWWGH